MEHLIKAGRWFFAICLAGLAGQQFYYGNFRPCFVPAWPSPMPGQIVLVCLFSIALIWAAIALVSGMLARMTLLLLGWLFLALVLLCHIPFHLVHDPDAGNIGVWNNAFKELCFSGSSLILASSFPEDTHRRVAAVDRPLEALIPIGTFFFSIMLIVFGMEHMLYGQYVKMLVPDWIPGHLFWTYFAGIALIGAGVGIMLRIKLRQISLLTGGMIFIWFIVLHIPRAVGAPASDMGNELTSVFQSLGFSGVAFVIAFVTPMRPRLTALA
jgi:uncharacterized membrane protein YphA (DoxX/SURF4 family)